MRLFIYSIGVKDEVRNPHATQVKPPVSFKKSVSPIATRRAYISSNLFHL